MNDNDMQQEPFEPTNAPDALLAAVEALADESNHTLDELTGRPMGELLDLAVATYGEADLPFFWRNWRDWAGPDPIQPMGDL